MKKNNGLKKKKKYTINGVISRLNDLEKPKYENVEYFIGVDTYDKNVNVYCLTKLQNKETTILLMDNIRDENEFKETVDNLAKYFNAKVIGD